MADWDDGSIGSLQCLCTPWPDDYECDAHGAGLLPEVTKPQEPEFGGMG